MSTISQINLPDSNTYNLSVPFIVGTGSTAGTWLGTLNGLTSYYDGLMILYKPAVAGASTTTLNLNNIGAKTCYFNNTTKLTTHYPKNQPILLAYSTSQNSGCWMSIDSFDTDTYPSALSATTAGTAAKTAACSYYTATPNSYVHVGFRYANTVTGAITLNINSRGAKPIYINGNPSSSTNHNLPAGTYLAFYDGTNYYFRTDGKIQASITGDAGTVGGKTVNDAILTIQKNGSTVKTFTANASTNVTCNITVPTATSDLTNDSSFCAINDNASSVSSTFSSSKITDMVTPWYSFEYLDTSTNVANTTDVTKPPNIDVNTAGVYLCIAHVHFAQNANGIRELRIIQTRNNTQVGISTGVTAPASNVGASKLCESFIFTANANDRFSLRLYQSSGGTLAATFRQLQVYRLSPILMS